MKRNDILRKLGVDVLSEMQNRSYDLIRQGKKDIVILSPTGTGKTIAYLLPLLEMLDAESEQIQAVVIVPSRELAIQSCDVMKRSGCGLRGFACYGGRSAMEEHQAMRKVLPHIIFATPGRLNDHLDKYNINGRQVKYLVIDEFDKCLEMGFADEMTAVIEKLPAINQRILLSATNSEKIPDFVNMQITAYLDFLTKESAVSERVSTFKVYSSEKDKLATLASLLRTFGSNSSIVFLNYRESVERVNDYLRECGFVTSAYHGGFEQKDREMALYKFSNGSANVLVSTDLASRGLDIPFVENIIHYHLPETEDAYIHRVGRTARWNASGNAFFILGPTEKMPEYITDDVDEYAMPESLPPVSLPTKATLYIGRGKQSKISKGDIVGFLCKKAGLKASDIGRIDVMDRYSYAAISRTKLDMVIRMANGEKIKGIKTVIEQIL